MSTIMHLKVAHSGGNQSIVFWRGRWLFCLAAVALLLAGLGSAQTPLDEESPWPRARSTNGHTVTLHLPQVEQWTSNWFRARAAVEVKPAGAKTNWVGVVWFEARGKVDSSNRVVTLDRVEITRGRFAGSSDQGTNALAIVRQVLPTGARTVSLDYLVTALGFAQAAARQGPAGLKDAPPQIFWVTNRTVLILVDGEPVRRPIEGTDLERVVNTPALLVVSKANDQFYLAGDGEWFTASSIKGPWALAQVPPAEVSALSPNPKAPVASGPGEGRPRIMVSTTPAELLVTIGLPDFRWIRDTALQYAANSDNQLFYHTKEREAYLLLSGRWFKAQSLHGPWSHVKPADLPPDFYRIPPGSAQGIVLASVPGTPQAELALLANSVPTTATVSRREAKIQLTYDGEPKFKPIAGTTLHYAVNASLPVIQVADHYYALDNAVWFVATSPGGTWEVATEVPDEIYTIPPSSPVYYATYARVYEATEEQVEVGYTPGYLGAFEEEGTVVYGTGWDYESWSDHYYYGWGWTWGYGYIYVPWYQWWIWHPWWTPPGGLRAAIIDNIYDRWRGRNGIVHYDQPTVRPALQAASGAFAGHPALYGRYWASALPKPQALPASTLALNPYARPQTALRPGDIPRGAQTLATVRQSPGGGRDLYASPDGNIYRRQADGWYQRQNGGGWRFYAPSPGTLERTRPTTARGTVADGNETIDRRVGGNAAAASRLRDAPSRAPNVGVQADAADVAALEREYYARSLAQARAQEWRGSGKSNRPGRAVVRRR